MTDTQNPATLPVVATMELVAMGEPTLHYRNSAYALDFGKHALTPHAPAQAAIDELRAEVERLRKDAGRLQCDSEAAEAIRALATDYRHGEKD